MGDSVSRIKSMKIKIFIMLALMTHIRLQSQEFSIIGKWQAEPLPKEFVTYDFSDSGNVLWIVRNDSLKTLEAFQAKYLLHRGKKFWEIDMFEFLDKRLKGVTFRGIIEVLSKDKIRLEGLPSNFGNRPNKFSDKALIFSKINGLPGSQSPKKLIRDNLKK
jgi:hypothetical protein